MHRSKLTHNGGHFFGKICKCKFCLHKIVKDFTKNFKNCPGFFKQVLNKMTQGVGKVFFKNAQVLNKATQGELFFQKQLKPMGYYSARKSRCGTMSIRYYRYYRNSKMF